MEYKDERDIEQIIKVFTDCANSIFRLVGSGVEILDVGRKIVVRSEGFRASEGLVSGGVIYDDVLNYRSVVAITKPRKESVCQKCAYRLRCFCKMELALPIFAASEIVAFGAIVCDTPAQSDFIHRDSRRIMRAIAEVLRVAGMFIQVMNENIRLRAEKDQLQVSVNSKENEFYSMIYDEILGDEGTDKAVRKAELEFMRKTFNEYGWDSEGKKKAIELSGLSRSTVYRRFKELEDALNRHENDEDRPVLPSDEADE